jgi:hypothetical protein
MALLVRTAAEVYDRRRQLLVLLLLALNLAAVGNVPGAAMFMRVVVGGAGLLVSPARDWSKGCYRVPNWRLDMYSDSECWEQLRWRREHIPTLALELGMPPLLRTSKGNVFTREEATVVLLRRFAHAGTWESILKWLGGRCRSAYVELFNEMLMILWNDFNDRITDISRWADSAGLFAEIIHASGAPTPRCIGFVDGTLRACSRPGQYQEEVYSGYKKRHGLKFQTVISPNGLITDFFGPISGRRGDGYMLRRSQLEARLAHLCQLAGAPFYVYGDPAYPLTKYILRGFKGPMTALQVVGWRV